MVTLKKAIPGHDFIDFKNNDALSNWLESRKMNQHLVYQNTDYDNITEVSSICLKCGVELSYGSLRHKQNNEAYKLSAILTRAKASLVLAKYENKNFCCIDDSYPYLKWIKKSKQWKIKKGFTKDQLPEESRKILEETSKLELFKDESSEPIDIQKVEEEKVESCSLTK